jgi:uncharacterized protein YggT (Ycf19 family)
MFEIKWISQRYLKLKIL